mgnify:CR=1 FL=1
MPSAETKRIKAALKSGEPLLGRDLDRLVVANMDLEELGLVVEEVRFGQVEKVRRSEEHTSELQSQ